MFLFESHLFIFPLTQSCNLCTFRLIKFPMFRALTIPCDKNIWCNFFSGAAVILLQKCRSQKTDYQCASAVSTVKNIHKPVSYGQFHSLRSSFFCLLLSQKLWNRFRSTGTLGNAHFWCCFSFRNRSEFYKFCVLEFSMHNGFLFAPLLLVLHSSEPPFCRWLAKLRSLDIKKFNYFVASDF